MVSQRVRHALVGIIVGMFVIQFFAVRLLGWEPETAVNAALLIIVGAVFSVEAFRRNNGGDQ